MGAVKVIDRAGAPKAVKQLRTATRRASLEYWQAGKTMIERFERFTLSIFNINSYWNKIATEGMKEYGLRGAYALYLVILAGYGGTITATGLAELCQRDKADVSRALAAFQKKGLLEPYVGPKYRATPVLSAKGKELAAQISGKANVALEQAGQGLSDEMRENMYKSLDIIAANMKVICESGIPDGPSE